jgi:hypothetical protein
MKRYTVYTVNKPHHQYPVDAIGLRLVIKNLLEYHVRNELKKRHMHRAKDCIAAVPSTIIILPANPSAPKE